MTSRIEQLMELCMQEEASEAERRELMGLLQAIGNEGEVKGLIYQALEGAMPVGMEDRDGVQGDGRDMPEGASAAVLEVIFESDAGLHDSAPDREGAFGRDDALDCEGALRETGRGKLRAGFFRRMGYAAAVVLVIAAGVVVAVVKNKPAPVVAGALEQEVVKDIPPGRNKAILTLADGATISLDDCKKGDIARDGNAQIVKGRDSGMLIYRAVAGGRQTVAGDPGTVAYNTITTPRGGQYQLALSDGSKVWLNASSSLRFPTTFAGTERSVELTGEGYFEIAKNTAMPFSINVNGVVVQVLGTRFNVNAYNDESVVRTTLVEGAVKVKRAGEVMMLRPGQQAVASGAVASGAVISGVAGATAADGGEGSLRLNPEADLEEVMAWKQGIFNFKNLDIESIMRQISRWYDV